MNVLITGSGGRECAIAWKLKQSTKVDKIYIIPGNAGTALFGENLNVSASDFDNIKNVVIQNNIDMIIAGSEDMLVNGLHDYFLNDDLLKGVRFVGPCRNGAILEGSKDYAKEFMTRHSVPTAKYKSFTKENIEEGYLFLESLKPPYVLKADGLAAGKGVVICNDPDQAKKELGDMLYRGKFGKASDKVVVEEYLKGIELSVFVATDGNTYKILPEAKDYKRVGEGDKGLNTGGMGAISPVGFADKIFMKKVEDKIIIPTIEGLKKDGIKYQGFLFIGLMNVNGEPYVIEYNVRLGDPETEVVIPRIKSDIFELFDGIATGTLSEKEIEIDQRYATTVMLVSGGYPGNFEKGKVITGLDQVNDSILFHAGTRFEVGNYYNNGGRVIAITSMGSDMNEALKISYKNAELINFDNKYFRRDIGFDLR
ncbi:MAG: phosphoribosylamine--glycine ligase [Bacteroidota bacterium]|nr:phosphoribosylamine--glycine ligase [Bacteroidota bacterium]